MLTIDLEVQQTVTKRTSVRFEFSAIPAGTFLMGSEKERPVHPVTISRAFHMGRYPVTQAQWEAVMGGNPSQFKGADLPVEQVTADDCEAFIERLNAVGKGMFRLPTEAEWEYACRAGSTGKFCFGDDDRQLGDYGWYSTNSDGQTQPVGKKKPNAWGLHDMLGNVAEWCNDCYSPTAYASAAAADPRGPESANYRVLRGGSWRSGEKQCRAAARQGESPGFADTCLGYEAYGFRCVKARSSP
jgi:formylglycine-generating enzyme required for sulfatase activity